MSGNRVFRHLFLYLSKVRGCPILCIGDHSIGERACALYPVMEIIDLVLLTHVGWHQVSRRHCLKDVDDAIP